MHPLARERLGPLGCACLVSMLLVGCSPAEAPPSTTAAQKSQGDEPRPVDAASSSRTHDEAEPPKPAEAESPKPTEAEPTEAEPTEAEPNPSTNETSAGTLASFTDEQRALMMAGEEEVDLPRPDISYVMSNESRHDVWLPYIDGIGGAYIGVGSDTNYTLIGYARSEIVFLVDHDPLIVNIHRVYEILIKASADPDTLLRHFEREHLGATIKLIESATAERPADQRRAMVRTYRATRETLRRYLTKIRVRRHKGCPSAWLSDLGSYEHLRTLYEQGRVRILLGDLRGKTTFPTVIAAIQALEIPVKVLYLSNAEQYFAYNKNIRVNLKSLPVALGGVVLRTIYQDTWEHADSFWAYQVQDIEDFQRRLSGGWLKRRLMWQHAQSEGVLERTTETRGLSRLAIAAPPSTERAARCHEGT